MIAYRFWQLVACSAVVAGVCATGLSEDIDPGIDWAVHNQGNIQLTVSNHGHFASNSRDDPITDPFTGDRIFRCTYPRNSGLIYHLGVGLVVGSIVDGDTLVSYWEYLPQLYPLGAIRLESIDNRLPIYSEAARSPLDIVCEYYDTITDPRILGPYVERHRTQNLKVVQRSMAWSGADLGDFVLFDYEIERMDNKTVENMYVGLYFFNSVTHLSRWCTEPICYEDFWGPLVGYLETYESPEGCGYSDRVDLAYIMDNDGDPVSGAYDYRSPLGAVGLMLLGAPYDTVFVNFNWSSGYRYGERWAGWHPQRQPQPGERLLDLTNLLWPYADKDAVAYYLMTCREIDYDQITTAVDKSLRGWLPPPPAGADAMAGGAPAMAILSFGPFKIGPGRKLPFAIAVVAGDNVHTDPTLWERLWNPAAPSLVYNRYDFSDLAENAVWARRVYDNPGVDTDQDGYAGEYRVCNGDTTWYKGDGVPDFRADQPPPAPEVKVIPSLGKLVIRWNGYYSETFIDPFTHLQDWEGYRVYCGLDDRRSSLSVLCSYDQENYIRFTLVQLPSGEYKWKSKEQPFTLDSLCVIYNDPNFDPLSYDRHDPLVYNGTRYYFTKQDYNVSDLTNPRFIHKVYPNATDPGQDSTLWTEDDITMEHGIPLPKFYEYEYVYDNLLPTVSYFVSVSAFDFGFSEGGIPAKESNILNSLIEANAQTSADTVEAYDLDVYVYPNPYRVDADYPGRGYENRELNVIPDRARLIHFSNLPNVCEISIWSLDGDLIRKIRHHYPEGGPNAMHETWDLITRNVQAVESGLYFWVVESATRTQIGKLVILK